MATVGLNFGSATSGAGFDVATTVTSILAISQGIETPWKTELTNLQAQDTVFSTLGTDLGTLSTALSSLTAADGVLAQKEGASSDTSVLTLTAADTTAVAGSHTVVVNSLATTSSKYSSQIAATDTLSGTITLAVGSGSSQTITLDSTDNTLTSLAAAINAGSYGVTASVISSTTGSRLSIVSNTSGAAGQLTFSSALTDSTTSSPVSFSTGQTGADASFTVDGLTTSSASNTVTGAIPGVTFQLLATAPNTSVQVQITNNNASVETAFQTLVTAYNAVVADIAGQEKNTSSGAAEPLFGNTTLALIQTQLATALATGTASGSIKSVYQLGLTVDQTGKLALNISTLDSVLNSNFSDVAGYLQNSGSWGETFSTTLNQLGNTSTTGAVALAQQQNSTRETQLNTDVTNEDALIATEKTTLTAQLTSANEILQSIPSQLNEQDVLYSSLTGFVASQH